MQAYLEIGRDNWCMLHVPVLPGVAFKAAHVEQALAEAGERIAQELAWLKAHGLGTVAAATEPETDPGFRGDQNAPRQPVVSIGGAVRTTAECAAGDTEAFYEPFAAPLSPAAVSSGLAYLSAARDDLLSLAASQPAAWLDVRPFPNHRTPREVLHHLADVELFYLVRLQTSAAAAAAAWKAAAGSGRPEIERLAHIRQRLIDALTGLDPAGRGRITVHDPHAERWSAVKVLYRAIWHDRHHARLLRQGLTSGS